MPEQRYVGDPSLPTEEEWRKAHPGQEPMGHEYKAKELDPISASVVCCLLGLLTIGKGIIEGDSRTAGLAVLATLGKLHARYHIVSQFTTLGSVTWCISVSWRPRVFREGESKEYIGAIGHLEKYTSMTVYIPCARSRCLTDPNLTLGVHIEIDIDGYMFGGHISD